METLKTIFVLFCILCTLAAVALIADSLGALDIYRAQQQTRAAEAQERAYQAQTLVIHERQTLIQTLILSLASVKDSLLVLVTYLIGGLMLLIAAAIIVILLLERGERHGRNL